MKCATSLIVTMALGVMSARSAGNELQVGSMAPQLEGCSWVKGDPVDLAAAVGKHLTVVEFLWTTSNLSRRVCWNES